MSTWPEHCTFLFWWPKFTSHSFDKMWPVFRSRSWTEWELNWKCSVHFQLWPIVKKLHTPNIFGKNLGFSQIKAQTTLVKKILLLFLWKLPKAYCKFQKRNRKLLFNSHSFGQKWTKFHSHSFQLAKKWPTFSSWTWTERELNGKSSVPTMLFF